MKTEKISNKRDHAPKKIIVLVGIMGAGKSTVGKILADRLGMRFFDADQEIERAAGCTITDFFEKYGEVEFRKGEERVISRILAGEPCVLATGGGAFMSEATRLLIKKMATSVWLRVSFEVLAKRLEKRSDRPLLQTTDPQQTLKALIKKRYPIYNDADFIVDAENDGVDITVSKVIECLGDYCYSEQLVES
ncbi:MAG: shikimate kinase [Pseudomonadota bacterium]|nr:shikimate kinase [Pseudomonadota bacterium]MED5300425.1 shikimate kinase [Pseudomonadota bacterium]|tara:strand:+ start:129 stop:704 length:576 start_codon:yes stop_codon:yes gene_type:complete